MSRHTCLRRRAGIRPRSPKRRAADRQRRTLVNQMLEELPWCQARQPGCTGRSTDLHERLRRSQGGDPLDETVIITVCRACHDWIGHHPAEAERLGLARWRWRAPSDPEGSSR